MTDDRLEILLRCLHRALEQGTRSWSNTQRSVADWTFNILERRGLMTPLLEQIREREQRWTQQLEEQLGAWNQLLAQRLGRGSGEVFADEDDEIADQGDPGEEPEDAPELQKPRPARAKKPKAPSTRRAAPRTRAPRKPSSPPGRRKK